MEINERSKHLLMYGIAFLLLFTGVQSGLAAASANLIHDAEQSILVEQFGDKWVAQDKVLQKKTG